MEKTNLVIPANSSPNSDNLDLISIIPWDKSDSSQGQITIYHDLTKSVPTFLVGSSERIVEEERNKTIVIEAVKIGVSEGKKSYADLNITQEAATYDYVLELYSDIEDNTIPSTGGSCNITAALVTYRNGRKVSTIKVNPQLSGSSTGFKLVGNVVTAENRNMVIGPDRYIVISGYTDETVTGDTVVGTIRIKQQRNIIESVDFNDTLLYDKDIPASGGSINPIITVDRTYTYTTGNTINNHIPDSEYIESKSETIEFTTTREPIDPFTLDENTGTVSAPSRGTVKGPRLELPVSMNYSLDIKYTFDENPISFEDSVSDSAYQAENGMVYSDIEAYGSTEEVPASGGTVSEALKVIYKQIASFSSGEVEEIISGADITYEPVEIPSKGTKISNLDKRGVLPTTISLNGKSVTIDIDIYQKGNYVESIKGSLGTFSYPTISAGATSATPDLSVGFGVLFTFSSGSTASNAPASTYGSLSVPSSFKLSASQNGFTAVNSSTGVLTATNRGATVGAARTSGTVTRTLTATWTPTSSYNAAGIKTDSWSTTATCTQAENTITSVEILNAEDAGAPVISVPAHLSVYGYTLRCYYSSGSIGSSVLPQSIINWSFDQTWGSLRDNVGPYRYYIYIEFSSRGTTIGSERSGTLSCIVNGEVNGVSINKTVSLPITQAANQVESIKIGGNSGNSTIWGDPKIDVACTENEWWQYSCWATYSSTATKSILASDFTLISNQSWATVSEGNANWLKRVDFASRGTTVGDARSVMLTANYSGKSAIVSVTQEANIIESEIIEVAFVYSKTIPYTGGTSTPSLSVDSIKTYSSEATSRRGVTNYTKVFSSSNLPDGFSLNTSNGVVTGENYTGSTERSASIKVDVSYTNTLGSVVTASKTATVVQGEADIVYSDPVITFTYLEAPASGGTLTPTLSVTQTWGYGQTPGGGSKTYNINTLPAGNYKITGTGVTPTDKGVVTISSLGTTIKPRTKLGSVLISVTLNGKTSSKSTDVYQEANNVERVAITTGGGVDDPLQTQFSAAGEAYMAAAFAYYTSEAKREIQDATFDNWAISGSGFLMTADPNYKYAVDIGAENRGTTVGPERSATISFEYSGKSDSITLTQEANEQKQTACSIEIDHDYQDPLGYNNTNVPAAGGRVCIVGVRHYSYTSGSTSQTEYDSFTLNCNQSWCVSDDESNLTISSRGTVTGSDRSATVYWQDGSFKSNEMTITQKANTATYGIPTGRTLSVSDIPASGGTVSSGTLGGTITQTRTFSSGASDTITNPTVTSSSYSAGVYNGSLGNTVVPRTKIGTLTYYYVCNGKTGSVSADVYQQANNETTITYGIPVVSLSVSDIPASGSTVSSGTVTYTQTRVQNYTSGGTRGLSNVTSGGSISYSAAVSASSKGTTVSSRTKVGTLTATVTLNGQKGSGSADVYQAANSLKGYSNVLINQFIYNNIPYSGGSSSPIMDITYDVTYDSGTYRDEHGLPSGYHITYATSGSWFDLNTSTGVITAPNNTTADIKSVIVTANLYRTSDRVLITSAQTTIKQDVKPEPMDIYITTSFDYASSKIQINFSSTPKDTFFIKFMGYDQSGGLWEYTTGITPSLETSFLFSPPGYSITDQFSIEGLGATEYTISPSSPYETSNARYYWQSTFKS